MNPIKQKLLLRALKRLLTVDKRSLDVARSTLNNELIQTLQNLKKSAAYVNSYFFLTFILSSK
jgi:hypothetical protein